MPDGCGYPSERVLHLRDNGYLVYATGSFMAHVTCHNTPANNHHFKAGVNRLVVSPSFSVSLQDHVIFAGPALSLDNQIREVS